MSEARKKRVLVLGWYGHGNLGDDSFAESFPILWPGCSFHFSDRVDDGVNDAFDACLVGGGSFFDSGLVGIERVEIPMAFVGVGVGRSIRKTMLDALGRARAIVVRDRLSMSNLPEDVLAKAQVASDLVLARPAVSFPEWGGSQSRKIAIVLSEHFAPRGDAAEWQAASWAWFGREFAQVLDRLCAQGYQPQFLPMSTTRAWDDRRACGALISRMSRAADAYWHYRRQISEDELLGAFADSRLVISQRLHGIVFAIGLGAPVVAIAGHDKVAGLCLDAQLPSIDYYACSAKTIESAVQAGLNGTQARARFLEEARGRWLVARDVVARELSL